MVPARWQPFVQLILARLREFFREPHVIFWVYGFPLILAVILGFAFSGHEPERPRVDVEAGPRAATIKQTLEAAPNNFEVEIHPAAECHTRLIKGKTALYLKPDSQNVEYVYDAMRSDSVLARYWAEAALVRPTAPPDQRAKDETVSEPGSRYIDWLLPGLLGMNVMGGGLFGIGFLVVDMRVRKLFKRLLATPMRHSDFLLALFTARLIFLAPEMLVLLAFGWLIYGVPVNGSIVTLFLTILIGAMAFSGLGLLLGCRTDKAEVISGLVNLVMLPSYLFSGIFFSSERFPAAFQPFIQALPLTQLNTSLREVMLDGAGIMDIAWRLAILAGWGAVCFALGLRWFRWR
jgi:ABC-type multidrug transport system permease subunit